MTATIPTLNASVPQIEAALRAGKTVQQVADEMAEPPNNVYGVLKAVRGRGEDPTSTGPTTATPRAPLRPVPVPPAPVTPVAGAAEPSVDTLIAAAARSQSKRTQALAVKLTDLATVVRDRLRTERETAERTAREKEERERAQAEFDELQARLAELRPKLRVSRAGSGGTRRAAKPGGSIACSKGCGKTFRDRRGIAVHEKACAGDAA